MATEDDLAHFLTRADELSDCASLVDHSDEDRVCYELRPNNPNAVGVEIIGSGRQADWINFTDPMSAPDDWRVDTESVDWHIDAAVEGRVRAFHGPSRGIVEVLPSGGGPATRSHYGSGLRSLIPRPGWKRRAKVIEYDPYR